MKHRIWMAALCLFTLPVPADTVRFKDGTSLDGMVSRPNPESVLIQCGKARFSYPASSIASIEPNDKKGDATSMAVLAGAQHQRNLEQRTGLTREQRDQVRQGINGLWSPDERERRLARDKLIELGRQMPVYNYIEEFIPYSKDIVLPQLLLVLNALDPKRARTTLIMQAQNPNPKNRMKSLGIIAASADKEDKDAVELVSRGLIDVEAPVRIAAADAITQLDAREATPLLIENLEHYDPQVRTASLNALQCLWKDVADAKIVDPEAWQRFWEKNGKSVGAPLTSQTLTPLVTAEELTNVNAHHDE